MDFSRLDLLEKKLTVMQQEISSVIGEMQSAMQAIMRGNQLTVQAMAARMDEIEQLLRDREASRSDSEGKEI